MRVAHGEACKHGGRRDEKKTPIHDSPHALKVVNVRLVLALYRFSPTAVTFCSLGYFLLELFGYPRLSVLAVSMTFCTFRARTDERPCRQDTFASDPETTAMKPFSARMILFIIVLSALHISAIAPPKPAAIQSTRETSAGLLMQTGKSFSPHHVIAPMFLE
jgi:hypothetical protein